MGLDPGSQRLKVIPLSLQEMVEAKGGEQADSPEKEGGGAAVCWHSNKQIQTERRSAAEVMKGPSAEDRTWPMFLSGSKPEASVAPLEVEGLLVVSYFFFPPVPLQIHVLALAERVSISEPPASFSSGLGVAS